MMVEKKLIIKNYWSFTKKITILQPRNLVEKELDWQLNGD
jgi:hypothetical protein